MSATELEEIRHYWNKKYPTIYISLWANEDGNKFFGRMNGSEENINLTADTIGELIGQGEAFLRKLK